MGHKDAHIGCGVNKVNTLSPHAIPFDFSRNKRG